jgi:hypothetical protein
MNYLELILGSLIAGFGWFFIIRHIWKFGIPKKFHKKSDVLVYDLMNNEMRYKTDE